MDRTMLAYYQEWLEGGNDATAEAIQSDLRVKAKNLAGPDANHALNYRMALQQELARRWGTELGLKFAHEIGRPWAPNAATDEYWKQLPRAVRESYTRQGELMFGAFLQGLSGEATAD